MRKLWKDYGKEYRETRISPFGKIKKTLSPKNRKIINDFINYCKMGSNSKSALSNKEGIMLQVYDTLETPLDKITLSNVRNLMALLNTSKLSPARKNDIKNTFKRFLKFYYENAYEKFKLREVRNQDERNKKKINSHTILKEEDIEKIIMVSNIKYKALISLIFESASRPEETLKLKWNDISFSNKYVKLHSSKTGNVRINSIKNSIHYLQQLKETLELESEVNDNDLIFHSPKDKNKKLTLTAVNVYFEQLKKKAGINKNVFPYLLRHSRLTPLIQILSPKAYEQFAGHSLEMGMRTYGHLSQEELNEEIISKVYEREELPKSDREKFEKEIEKLKQRNKEEGKVMVTILNKLDSMGIKIKH